MEIHKDYFGYVIWYYYNVLVNCIVPFLYNKHRTTEKCIKYTTMKSKNICKWRRCMHYLFKFQQVVTHIL